MLLWSGVVGRWMLHAGTAEENMSTVWAQLREHLRARHVTTCFRNLHIGMFTKASRPNANFPKLKGRAAEIKSLGGPLLAVWSSYMDNTSVVHRQLHLMLRCCVHMDTMIQTHKDLNKYPEPIFSEFMKTCENYLVVYTALAGHYNSIGVKVFNVVKNTISYGTWLGCRST